MLAWIHFQLSVVLGVLCLTHAQICRENIALLADSKLDHLHTVLSRRVKSVLEWHFQEEGFICSLWSAFATVLILYPDLLYLHTGTSFSLSNSNLGKSSPTLFQLKCAVTSVLLLPLSIDISHAHFCIIFVSFVYAFCWHLHGPMLHVRNNLPVDANHSVL